MLTKAQEAIPRTSPTVQLAYEMKWDGYRAVLQVTPDGTVRLWSRNGTDLSRAFPNLFDAAHAQVPAGIVLDGEAVAWVEGRLSFDHLQHRMAASDSAARQLARQRMWLSTSWPLTAPTCAASRGAIAALCSTSWPLAFSHRFRSRRTPTSTTPPSSGSPICPQRPASRGSSPSGSRRGTHRVIEAGVKVKRRTHHDAVVGAVIGPVTRPEAIVAGRYTVDGQLRIVGRSGPLTSQQAEDLSRVFTTVPAHEHQWPEEISSGHFGGGQVAITHVSPVVVVEVSADSAVQGGRHRHALRLIRLRTDLAPSDITTD